MLSKITQYLVEQLDLGDLELTAETTFESLDLDSLDIVEMIVELETDSGIELEEDEIKGIETLGNLAALIESKMK